ncbi:MAG: hypothetical protein E7327_04740 [Clostridiales bacterium]|nr:hypothetical protein [Clostridiales bacterium]
MPLTSYCKKCGRDVPVRDRCPDCNAKLPASSVRLAWCVEHLPVKDWMCWNAVLRIVLPVLALTLLMIVAAEWLLGGPEAAALLMGGSLLTALGGLMIALLAALLLVFILQGEDLLDCVIDSAGLHVQQYLQSPTPLKLLLRLRSPRLMEQVDSEGLLLLSSREISWKAIRRVQLWPEKTMLLLYAPRWWMRLSVPCTPFTWDDALGFIRDKIGKRKDVILPPECIQVAPPKPAKPKRTKQLSFEDIQEMLPPAQPIPEEEVPDWTRSDEQPGDFTPLADVLEEIRQQENA